MTVTFDSFTPGQDLGTTTVRLDDGLVKRWVKLYPHDAECLPRLPEGMVSVIVMRAYIDLTCPRPPGNVHASQDFVMHAMPKVGDTVTTRMICAEKELKRNRRWVTLTTESHDDAGKLLFTGEMRLIWAA